MQNPSTQNLRSLTPPLFAFGLTIALFAGGSLFPDARIWGINTWAHWPPWLHAGICAFIVAVGLYFAYKMPLKEEAPLSDNGKLNPLTLGILIAVISGIIFVFLRTRIHLLGDGYTLLSLLGRDIPLIKPREFGESLVHIWIRDLLGGPGHTNALMSFRIISIGAGLVVVATTFYTSIRLFTAKSTRLIFTLGILSSGFMLLYFGYVENYSLLTASMLLYTLAGILVCRGYLSRWWLLLPASVAPFMHIVGIVLLPSLAIPLMVSERTEKKDTGMTSRLIVAGLIALVGLVYVAIKSSSDLFYQLALLPLTSGRFTIDSYTLFSITHLIDFVNLTVLLFPGTLIALLFVRPTLRSFRSRPEIQFLVVLTISCIGIAFVIDPKLGMPRDWDLLAFAGIPLVVLAYYSMTAVAKSTVARQSAMLSILLGFTLLFSRVGVTIDTDASVAQFKTYLQLDGIRGLTGWRVLSDFYAIRGNDSLADETLAQIDDRYAHGRILNQADSLLDYANPLAARTLYYRVLDENPIHHPAWFMLGNCYMDLRRLDSARICFEIADALNPYNPQYLNNLAGLHYYARNTEAAENAWLRSYAANKDPIAASNLLKVYQSRGDQTLYIELLENAAQADSATVTLVRDYAEYQISKRDSEVSKTLSRLLNRFGDTAWVEDIYARYPSLR